MELSRVSKPEIPKEACYSGKVRNGTAWPGFDIQREQSSFVLFSSLLFLCIVIFLTLAFVFMLTETLFGTKNKQDTEYKLLDLQETWSDSIVQTEA